MRLAHAAAKAAARATAAIALMAVAAPALAAPVAPAASHKARPAAQRAGALQDQSVDRRVGARTSETDDQQIRFRKGGWFTSSLLVGGAVAAAVALGTGSTPSP